MLHVLGYVRSMMSGSMPGKDKPTRVMRFKNQRRCAVVPDT